MFKQNFPRRSVFQIIATGLLAFSVFACRTTIPDAPVAVDTEVTVTEAIATEIEPTQPVPTATSVPSATIADESLPTPLPSIGDPYAPELGNTGIDVTHYTLELAFDPASSRPDAFEGSVLIEAMATQPLDEIWLDFVGFEISELLVNDAAADFERRDDKLVIGPDVPLQAGESFRIFVTYAGSPEIRQSPYVPFVDHLGLFYSEPDKLFVLAEPDGARFWFPCNDHPPDKASFNFLIAVPEGYTAAANGELTSERQLEDGNLLSVWEHDFPMAPYLATVAIGHYERIDQVSPNGFDMRHYVYAEHRANFEAQLDTIGEAMDWLTGLLGFYPFETFGYVSIPSQGASLETQTLVMLDTNMVNPDVIVHEMTHMWFGDWVSLDSWGEMWRNEGFATYFQWYYPYRGDPEGFEAFMELRTQDILSQTNLEPLNDLSKPNLFGYESYIKGAVAVHALRQAMGDEAFFEGLRMYLAQYGGGTASDADFKAVMEAAAGISLDGFFAEWIGE
ncbi:MAG: hypothetical protein JXB38_03165 [Anaerolineales bacterium]|nr:hypothetical protein [Anaerolineales bacterium]